MKILQLLIAGILLTSCNYNSNNEEAEEHQQVEAPEELRLNDGVEWQANSETTDGINNMVEMVNQYGTAGYGMDFLKQFLGNELNNILDRCTMTGEAQQQLHHYIIPLRKKIEGLNDDNVDELGAYLELYYKYFETERSLSSRYSEG